MDTMSVTQWYNPWNEERFSTCQESLTQKEMKGLSAFRINF